MDMTSIVRFDENTRKSLGQRVSFANHAMFACWKCRNKIPTLPCHRNLPLPLKSKTVGQRMMRMCIQMLRASSVVALCANPLLSARVVTRNRWTWTLTTWTIPHAAFFRAGNNFDEGDYLVTRATMPTTIWTRQKLYHIISCNDVPHLVYPASHLQTSLLLRRPWITEMKRWMRHLWRCHL